MADTFDFKINLIKASNFLGEQFYTGTVKLKHFLKTDFYKVPIYNSSLPFDDPESGYQRAAKETRINQVSERLKNSDMEDSNAPFVDNVNLNLRNPDIAKYVRAKDPNKQSYGHVFEFQYISQLGSFYIIDGQTRIRGAQRAYQYAIDHGDFKLRDQIENTQVQISLSFISDVYKEAYLFYLINNHSKAIPADGAVRLLQEGKKSGSVVFQNEITNQNKERELLAYGIAEKLNNDSTVWAGRMKDFNDTGRSLAKTTMRSVAKVVEKVYASVDDYYRGDDSKSDIDEKNLTNNVYNIIEAYWIGVKNAFREMFKPDSEDQYAVLKAGPSEIMFLLLIEIIKAKKILKNSGVGDLDKPETYYNLVEKLKNLEDMTPDGAKIRGVNVFKIGSAGAIGKYSNTAAKKNMATKMKHTIWPNLA